jgi:hypothetical protein
MEELKILCPYCNSPYSGKMKAEFDYSMGSEWTGMYGEDLSVEIYCDNCKKLVYKKNSAYSSSFDEREENNQSL